MFDISCKLSTGDNLHKMSEPGSWEQKKKNINLSFAEFAQKNVMVNQGLHCLAFCQHVVDI